MGHVVAITHIGERLTSQISEGFPHGEEVRQGLAGMLKVGEGIDHWNRGPVRVIRQLLLSEGANGEHVTKTAEHPGGVFQWLTASQLGDLGVEIHGLAAQPGHRHLETHPRAGGGLGEDQAEHPIA